jgi:hypothetical protein
MTDETTPQTGEPGLIGRAIGVITSPGATFAHVVRDPRPVAILLVVAVIIAVAQAIPQFTEAGRQAIIDTQLEAVERMTGQPVTDEVYQQMVDRASINAYVGIGFTFIFLPIVALIFGGLYWGVFNAIFGGTASFKQVLGLVTHSMVIGAVGALISAPIQLMSESISVGGPFNLGALLPMLDPESFLARFLGFISAITIWQIIVMAIGLGVLYRRKSTGIAIGLLVAYGLIVAAGVTVFGALFGG